MNSNPWRTSSTAEGLGPWRGRGVLPIAISAIAETQKLAASTAKARLSPRLEISQPAAAGPARRSASGRTNWSSELAAASWSAGRMSGTIASNAGLKNAVPTP